MNLEEKGLATRRAVLGDTYVDGALAKATPFTGPLQELVTRHAWGNTWQRPGIDAYAQHRHRVDAGGAGPHARAQDPRARRVYCGFPAAVDAFRTAAEVIDDPATVA